MILKKAVRKLFVKASTSETTVKWEVTIFKNLKFLNSQYSETALELFKFFKRRWTTYTRWITWNYNQRHILPRKDPGFLLKDWQMNGYLNILSYNKMVSISSSILFSPTLQSTTGTIWRLKARPVFLTPDKCVCNPTVLSASSGQPPGLQGGPSAEDPVTCGADKRTATYLP